MSSRQFTWWRRFYSTLKLKTQHFWKGYSKLLQRIEFGEFEYNHLGYEMYLEDAIHEEQSKEIRKKFERSTRETIEEKIRDNRIKKNKRLNIIFEKHLITEFNLLNDFRLSLAAEFDMDPEFVEGVMEEFDGTTRHLFFHLMAIKYGKPLPTAEDVQMIPRAVEPQPRHVLKHGERQYQQLWDEVVKEKNIPTMDLGTY